MNTSELRQAYFQIINHELIHLTQEQLYKVLVLVKNTIEQAECDKKLVEAFSPGEKREDVVEPPKFYKNKCLFPEDPSVIATSNNVSLEMEETAGAIQQLIYTRGLIGGHGILSMNGYRLGEPAGKFICFCIEDSVDMMVEIREGMNRAYFTYYLTIRRIHDGKKHVTDLYSFPALCSAIDNVIKNNK